MDENTENPHVDLDFDDEIADGVEFDEDGNPYFVMKPRSMDDVAEEVERLVDIVWYNRCHLRTRYEIAAGDVEILPWKEAQERGLERHKFVDTTIWETALKAAARIEEKYDEEELDPGDDFDWGMINGKLSALRWVLGEEWDFLDT